MSDPEEDALAQLAEARRQADEMAAKAGYVMSEDGQYRRPSKAAQIGTRPRGSTDRSAANGFGDPQPGDFIRAVAFARSGDFMEQMEGKSALEGMSRFMSEADVRATGSKATLGLTDATGGWIVPNAIVDEFIKPASYTNIYRSLATVRSGVRSAAVDIPWRASRPTRAVIQTWGQAKENLDLTYNGYTATMAWA